MSLTELGVAVAIAVGLVGILVPVLPGSILVLGAILLWALDVTGGVAWAVFALAATFLVLGSVVKYVVPGRRLSEAGIPATTQWWGVGVGIVGFFVTLTWTTLRARRTTAPDEGAPRAATTAGAASGETVTR